MAIEVFWQVIPLKRELRTGLTRHSSPAMRIGGVGGERLKSRGCGQVTHHQETRDPQLACIFLFAIASRFVSVF